MSAHHTADEAAPRTSFRLLGPLEAVCGRQTLPLGGLRRRAVLAYLLLHPNEVVSVSRLVQALWGSEAPASARKVCQNSVWQLRRILQDPGGGEGPADARLLTREPGYLLEIAPALIDVSRFHELADTGRAELAAGYSGAAASAWRQALGLWSGPVLADLTENEIHWPECEAVENARLDVLESCFQAELLLGRHEALLPELTMTARAHPRREKFLQQLMLALYRSGRQTEALATYDHARGELARDLGLEPGRELGALRQAILTQDTAALDGFQSGTPARNLPTCGPADRRNHLRAVPEMPCNTADGPAPAARTVQTVVERRDVTVAILRLAFRPVDSEWDPEDLDTLATATDEVLRREVCRYGGTLADRAATTWTVVFGTRRMRDDDVRNAVLLCLEMRRRLSELTGGLPSVGLQAAVEAGEALVRAPGTSAVPPEVMGVVLERCRRTLPSTDRQEVRVGAEAHAVVREDFFTFRPSRGIRDTWTVEGIRSVAAPIGPALVGRDRETAALRNVRDAAPDRPLPVMTLVTGVAGMGKSALLQELAARRPDEPSRHQRVVVEVVARACDQNSLAVIARNLVDCCDLAPQDTLDQVAGKVRATVRRIAHTAQEAAWLEKCLQAAFLGTGENFGYADGQETGEAWWRFLGRLAAERPVLVLADDLDTADEELLDRLDQLLVAPDPSPGLQVIACAGPALLRRRPAWSGTGPGIAHLPLLALADQVIENQIRRLLGFLGVTASGLGHTLEEACAIAVFLSAGNPGFASELVHCALRRAHENSFAVATADSPALLLPVRSRHMLGARLDELPTAARSVLVDAAFVGERLWPGAVAALRQRVGTGTGAALDDLVWRGLLARTAHSSVPGETEYRFVEPLLRYVAVSRIPRAGRERKQAQLAEWRRRNGKHGDEPRVTGSDHDLVSERLRRFHALFAKAVAEREPCEA